MKKTSALIIIILLLVSCRGPIRLRYVELRRVGKEVQAIQDSARILLPDSLLAHFPKSPESGQLVLQSVGSSFIIGRYPKLQVERTFPWLYQEEYQATDSGHYLRLKVEHENESFLSKDKEDRGKYYSFDSLALNRSILTSNYFRSQEDSLILVPDIVFRDTAASTIIVKNGQGLVLPSLSKGESRNDSNQRFVSGISFLDDSRSIYYWTIIW